MKYGVHKHFKRKARYICFFRDPISRTVSIYNHKRRLFSNFSNLNEDEIKNLKSTLLIKNKVPDFEEWVEKRLDTHKKGTYMSVHRLLIGLGYLEKPVTKKYINKIYKQVVNSTKHKRVSGLVKLKRRILLPFTQVFFAPKDTLKIFLKYN